MTLDEIIERTMGAEGGTSDDPDDSGGLTKYGITQATYTTNGGRGLVTNITRAQAKEIYKSQYLIKPGFGDFISVSSELAAELFDTGVNMGPAKATEFLQRATNALSGSKLEKDGKMGPATRKAVNDYLKSRSNAASILVKALNCLQGVRYIEIVEANSSQRKFINGWIANRVEI